MLPSAPKVDIEWAGRALFLRPATSKMFNISLSLSLYVYIYI